LNLLLFSFPVYFIHLIFIDYSLRELFCLYLRSSRPVFVNKIISFTSYPDCLFVSFSICPLRFILSNFDLKFIFVQNLSLFICYLKTIFLYITILLFLSLLLVFVVFLYSLCYCLKFSFLLTTFYLCTQYSRSLW
jgi:hypothetical protein